MRARSIPAAVFLLSAALATPGQAQSTGASAPSENVVVTGQRSQESLQEEISDFVRSYGRFSRIEQLTRWRDPVCVHVDNLPPAYNAFIEDRVETIAREAGAPTNGGSACQPNIQIIFTPDPQQMMDHIASEEPDVLGYHFVHQRRGLAAISRPVQAWYVTATSNGVETVIDDTTSSAQEYRRTPGSRLTRGLESVFVHVLIIVDSNEVADAPVGPLADYLAMLSLTQMRDQDGSCGGLVSIVELFSIDCPAPEPPQALTEADRSFLSALYAVDSESIGSLQQSGITRRMGRELRDD
jgi:hypothetical protein